MSGGSRSGFLRLLRPDAVGVASLLVFPYRTTPRCNTTRTPGFSQSDRQPGDILFFGSPIHHDAMYIGNGQILTSTHGVGLHPPINIGEGRSLFAITKETGFKGSLDTGQVFDARHGQRRSTSEAQVRAAWLDAAVGMATGPRLHSPQTAGRKRPVMTVLQLDLADSTSATTRRIKDCGAGLATIDVGDANWTQMSCDGLFRP
jgi:hypothetical protein